MAKWFYINRTLLNQVLIQKKSRGGGEEERKEKDAA